MRKPAISLVLSLVLALVIGAVGCGGGEGTATPTPTPTPTATPSPTSTTMPTPTPTPTATPIPPPMARYLTHTDAVSGFSVSYPEDWETKALPSVLFAVGSPQQCRGQDTTFYLQRMELTHTTDIETFFGPTLSHTFLSRERSFISGEKLGVSGRSAIKWMSTISNIDGSTFKEMSVYLIDGRTAWILIFTTVSSCWKQYEEAFEYMLGSFQLLS